MELDAAKAPSALSGRASEILGESADRGATRRYIEVRNRLVKAILEAGGKILAGSDTPEWFFGYGFSLHRELEALVAAGLNGAAPN
ncbi:MAG: hypothetical protein ACRD2A_13435 [Vicinamibacterales bacterium]